MCPTCAYYSFVSRHVVILPYLQRLSARGAADCNIGEVEAKIDGVQINGSRCITEESLREWPEQRRVLPPEGNFYLMQIRFCGVKKFEKW